MLLLQLLQDLTLLKKLAGRKLKAGEFSFVLKDQDGNVIETVKNDEEGNVTFTELSYDNTKNWYPLILC